eukprot:COSAG01_NODE_1894_length_8959_cov_3.852603_10_plen_261_part_00
MQPAVGCSGACMSVKRAVGTVSSCLCAWGIISCCYHCYSINGVVVPGNSSAVMTALGARDVANLETRNHTNIGLSNHKVTRRPASPAPLVRAGGIGVVCPPSAQTGSPAVHVMGGRTCARACGACAPGRTEPLPKRCETSELGGGGVRRLSACARGRPPGGRHEQRVPDLLRPTAAGRSPHAPRRAERCNGDSRTASACTAAALSGLSRPPRQGWEPPTRGLGCPRPGRRCVAACELLCCRHRTCCSTTGRSTRRRATPR